MLPDPLPQIAFAVTLAISLFTLSNWLLRIVRPYFRSPVDRTIEIARFNMDASKQIVDTLTAQIALVAAERDKDQARLDAMQQLLSDNWNDRAAFFADWERLRARVQELETANDDLARRLALAHAGQTAPGGTP